MADTDATSSQSATGEADGRAGGAYVYVIAFVAAAGGFNFGFDIVLMSGAILYLQQTCRACGVQAKSAHKESTPPLATQGSHPYHP